MSPKIIEKEPISIPELKKELKKIEKRDKELNFRAQRTIDYANEFSKLKYKQAMELKEKLIALEIPRLKNKHIKKIIDILPINEKQLKVILSGYTITINSDNLKKISSIVKEYL